MWNTNEESLSLLVAHMARAVHGRNPWIDLDDLKNQAWLEVLIWEKNYDPEQGNFTTWARKVIDKKLNNYAGLCNAPVSAGDFRKLKKKTPEIMKADILPVDDLKHFVHPERQLGQAQVFDQVRQVVHDHLIPNPDREIIMRVLMGATSVCGETTDLGERNRLHNAISRVRKQLREISLLRELFNQIKEVEHED